MHIHVHIIKLLPSMHADVQRDLRNLVNVLICLRFKRITKTQLLTIGFTYLGQQMSSWETE